MHQDVPCPSQTICTATSILALGTNGLSSEYPSETGAVGPAHCLGPLRLLILGAQLVPCEVTEQEGERTETKKATQQGDAHKTLAFLGWNVGKGRGGPKAKRSPEVSVPILWVRGQAPGEMNPSTGSSCPLQKKRQQGIEKTHE